MRGLEGYLGRSISSLDAHTQPDKNFLNDALSFSLHSTAPCPLLCSSTISFIPATSFPLKGSQQRTNRVGGRGCSEPTAETLNSKWKGSDASRTSVFQVARRVGVEKRRRKKRSRRGCKSEAVKRGQNLPRLIHELADWSDSGGERRIKNTRKYLREAARGPFDV